MKTSISKPKFLPINKSRKDLLNSELADNLDVNNNCKLTKLVYNTDL